MKPILVIGGINMDVLGEPKGAYQLRDSAPGSVHLSPGGVGHNIARQLASMGQAVQLMAPFGDDLFGAALRDSCLEAGIGLDYALSLPGSSCVYMAIHDDEGDMLAAINSMALMEKLSGDRLERTLPRDGFSLCVLDANLSEDALASAARHMRAPLLADPVSAAKCARLQSILARLFALKPNLMEARALTGLQSPEEAADCLLSLGLRQVYISLGRDGLYFASETDRGYIKPNEILRAPATGAGDAMTAGLALAIASGLPAREAAMLSMKQAEERLRRNMQNAMREEE